MQLPIPEGCHLFSDLKPVGNFKSPAFLHRSPRNPILSRKDIPYDAHLVFNCSVIEEDGGFLMIFRNDVHKQYGTPGGAYTNFGLARSQDGISWKADPRPIFKYQDSLVSRAYDPRMIKLEGKYYLTCCAVTAQGPRAATLVSADLKKFELIDMSLPASRNTLLFPEKINGKYYRLERPFWEGIDGFAFFYEKLLGRTFDTWIAGSPDLTHWGEYKPLILTSQVPYANIKIGPGATPIKTERGWLLLIHGVDHDPARGKNGWEPLWPQRYHGGVALLDLHDPTRLIGLGRTPLITPEAPYEINGGYRNNVIFPMTGIVKPNREVLIYYGAADAVICLATAPLNALLDMCEPIS